MEQRPSESPKASEKPFFIGSIQTAMRIEFLERISKLKNPDDLARKRIMTRIKKKFEKRRLENIYSSKTDL